MDKIIMALCAIIAGAIGIYAAVVMWLGFFGGDVSSDLNFCRSHNFTWVSHEDFGTPYCNRLDAGGFVVRQEIDRYDGVWYFVHKGEPTSVSILGG